MADVFTLRDAKGVETKVKEADLQTWISDQITAASKAAVPEGSVVIQASKLAEFEATGATVVSLKAEVETLKTTAATAQQESENAKQEAFKLSLRQRLDVLSRGGRITKPMRDWAEKTFTAATMLAGFDEWAASLPKVVPVQEQEQGSSLDATLTEGSPAAEVQRLALAKQAEARGLGQTLSLSQAASAVLSENTELARRYRGEIFTGGSRARH